MKRLMNIITKRSTTALILFLVEIILSGFVVLFLGRSFLIFGILIYFFNILILFFIANGRANPAYKISWIFTVILLPFVGAVLYITFGKRRTVKKFRRKFINAENINSGFFKNNKDFINSLEIDPYCLQMMNWIYNVSKYPVHNETKTKFLKSGTLYFKSLIEDLKKAEKSIFLEFFIISPGKMWGEILDILIEKVNKGLDVRLIYDDIGTIASLPNGYEEYLRQTGIKCEVFNPVKLRLEAIMNNRDHRKMVVIDGFIAYTGGVNIADEYINEIERFGFWQDCGVKLEGRAAFSFVVLFLNMWNYLSGESISFNGYIKKDVKFESDGLVMPFGDNPVNSYYLNDSIYLKIVSSAREYVYIQTPYLIIDNKLTNSLIFAAQSGVEVVIITPHIPDKAYVHALTRSSYKKLIKAGVKIYEFTPGFIHSKLIVADDSVAVVGTANFDFRSLYLHFECSVFLYKTASLQQIYCDFKRVIGESQEITLEKCKQRSWIQKLLGFVLRPFAPLM